MDLLALGGLPLEAVVTAKMLAHWIVTGVPLILGPRRVLAMMLGAAVGRLMARWR